MSINTLMSNDLIWNKFYTKLSNDLKKTITSVTLWDNVQLGNNLTTNSISNVGCTDFYVFGNVLGQTTLWLQTSVDNIWDIDINNNISIS